MKITRYNKLIRDKIPQIIRRGGAVPKLRRLSGKRFVEELKRKLVEESAELRGARGRREVLDELSDVLEVARTVARVEKIAWRAVERRRKVKARERGGFRKKIFLREVQRPK